MIAMPQCGQKCEVYSRVVGYLRPLQNWNLGKQEEFKDRIDYSIEKALKKADEDGIKTG